MKKYIFLLLLASLSSCIVKQDVTAKNYRKGQMKQSVNEMEKKINSPNKGDIICDLRFLVKTFGNYAHDYKDFELDEERINFIKDELIKVYEAYNSQNKKAIIITPEELKKRINCYLDYLTNDKYKPAGFFEFWENEHYKKYRCNIIIR